MSTSTYTYTFIIPHHNSPELLNRCLDSIPQREDIQIIVVDDNSAENKRPCIKRNDVEVIYIDAEHTKGAGRARNYGLKAAKGKWLLFSDADDMYDRSLLSKIDNVLNDAIDILYFDFYNNYDIKTSVEEYTLYHQYIADYIKAPTLFSINRLKYGVNAAWNKVFNATFVRNSGVQFEEIPAGNDIYFVHTCGSKTNRVVCIPDKLYYYIKNPQGITFTRLSKKSFKARVVSAAKHIRFIQDQGAWDIGNYSWPSIREVIKNYGCLFAVRIFFMKNFLFRPSWYVKYKHRELIKEEQYYLHQKHF